MSKQGHHKRGSKNQSPKLRHRMQREAKENDVKAKPSDCNYESVSEALSGGAANV